jgi:hypothetical protein
MEKKNCEPCSKKKKDLTVKDNFLFFEILSPRASGLVAVHGWTMRYSKTLKKGMPTNRNNK